MSYSILIVDDNAVVRRFVRCCFEGNADFHVCGEASDGFEAIQKTHELNPDLVILDLSMPRMNGLEAAREIKRTRPHVLLLMFTTFKSPEVEKEAVEAGCSTVLCKAEVQMLSQTVRGLLAQN